MIRLLPILFFLFASSLYAQLQISVSPITGTNTACTNANITCANFQVLGSAARMRVTSISGTTVNFAIERCNSTVWPGAGTAALRSTNCGTNDVQVNFNANVTTLQLSRSFTQAGTYQVIGYVIYTVNANSIRVYTNPITVTVTNAQPNLTANNASFSPNPLVQGGTPSISNIVRNTGTGNFNGTVVLSWHSGSGAYITDLASFTGNIAANGQVTLTRPSTALTSAPGSYQLVTKVQTGPSTFTNLNVTNVTVVSGAQPNLTANNASFSPNPLVQGGTPSISNIVRNTGTGNFNGTVVLSWHSGTGAYITDLASFTGNIAANGQETLTRPSTALTSAPGSYQLVTKVQTGPSTFTNLNVTNVTVVSGAQPNLTASAASFSPNPLVQGGTPSISNIVRNTGAGNFNGTVVLSWHSGTGAYLTDLASFTGNIAANGQVTLTRPSTALTSAPGSYQLVTKVQTGPSTFTNLNVTNVTVVSGTQPNLTASAASFSPNPLVQGGTPSISNIVRNTGTGNFNGTVVLSWHSGTGAYLTDLASFTGNIAANGQVTLTRPSTALTSAPGSYQLVTKVQTGSSTFTNLNVTNVTVVSPSYTCTEWDVVPPNTDFTDPVETPLAFEYLCNKQIIDKAQLRSAIKTEITRENLAKISFRGLFTPNVNQSTPADNFPVPFIDLQTGAYPREAKVLSYLEYGDGVSVFARRFTHFRAKAGIQRRDILKAFLEVFNIKPDWTGYNPTNSTTLLAPFNDVFVNDPAYGYIRKARQLGIISSNVVSFKPSLNATREESFLYLYRTMKLIDAGTVPKPNANVATAYFTPNNITPLNFARVFSIVDASFNNYTKTSFGIAGKVPLSFAHSYNSYLTELPEEYQYAEPMGKGWNHNYNVYLRQVDGDETTDRRFIIFWGDGSMVSFKLDGSNYIPETEGVYSRLTRSSSVFTLTTKEQVRYRFTQVASVTGGFWALTSVLDRNNNTLSLVWESYIDNGETKGRIKRVNVHATQRYLDFVYNAQHKLSAVSAITGSITRSIQFTYTKDGDLRTYTDPKGQTTTYFYEGAGSPLTNHLLTRIQLPRGNSITNTYENRKLKSSQVNNQFTANIGFSTNYTGAATNTTNSSLQITRGGTTLNSSYTANALGKITHATSPTSNIAVNYDPVQKTKPQSITNNTTNVSAGMTYDANGNVLTASRTGGGQTITETFTYNALNDVVTHTNGRGFTTTFGYDARGNLTRITDALGNITTMTVNTDGTVQRVTNPEALFTQFGYNTWGNLVSSSQQGIITSSILYDDASRIIEATNPLNVKTRYSYDLLDQVLEVINDFGGLNQSLKYEYDANGNPTKVINPKNVATNFTYDNDDQLTQYEFGGFTRKYEYNTDGSVKKFTNQRGDVSDYLYNAAGQMVDDGYATYTYDAQKRLRTVRHKGNNRVITYGYDAFNRIRTVSYDDFAANTVTYDYDNNNNVVRITYPGSFAVAYTYDAINRLIRVSNAATNANYATYEYLKDGRLKKTVNGNTTFTNYGYDNIGRLNLIDNRKSDNSVLGTYSFTLDNLGNHTQETANEPFAPPMPVPAMATTTYTHDNTNRMTQQGGNTFEYDGNGNNTAVSGQANSTYTYDKNDNLLTSTTPALTMEYDGLENRRRKNDTRYVLDILGGSNVLMETNLTGIPQAFYIHGLGLIARLDANQANISYYHYDYRGSTTAITNAMQTVTHIYTYGAFGELLQANENGFANNYRYVGKFGVQYEDSTLYFMRARYYNPSNGRFMGEDPIWDSNLFAYSYNNPIDFIDPSGKIPVGLIYNLGRLAGDAAISIYESEVMLNAANRYFSIGSNAQSKGQSQVAIYNFNQASIYATEADRIATNAINKFKEDALRIVFEYALSGIKDKYTKGKMTELENKKFANFNTKARAFYEQHKNDIKNLRKISEIYDYVKEFADIIEEMLKEW